MKRLFNKIKSHSLKELLQEYKWLMGCSIRYKRQILWYLFVGVFGTAMGLAGSILSKYIIDAVTQPDSSYITTALVFFVCTQLLQIGVRAISSRISARISIEVNQQITSQVYNTLLKTDWESLSAYHSGDLLSRINGDVATVSSSVLGWIPDLCTRLLQFTVTFGIILYYDRTLALLALLTAPVTLLMSRYIMEQMRHHNKKMRQLSSEMTVFNEESFQNIQLIKAFNQADAYNQKQQDLLKKHKDASLAYNRFSIQKSTVMSLIGTVVTLLCFGWSIHRLQTDHISYGTMVLFLQLATTMSSTFSALAGMIPSAISAATAAGRIMTITQLPQENPGDPQQVKDWLQRHKDIGFSLTARKLSYHYDDGVQVLSQVDFQVNSGQIIALTGPSGEGKTTLLRLLLGIIHPKDGVLQLCGKDGECLPITPATRTLFAYVPQGNTLFSGTIEENLRMIRPDATQEALQQALKTACAWDFVSQLPFGLQTSLKERGGGLSEGQLQRLCIARALLSDAPILLMDEATSALDIQTEQQVLQNIIATNTGRTCILSTHRPSVLACSDHIFYISDVTLTPTTIEDIQKNQRL